MLLPLKLIYAAIYSRPRDKGRLQLVNDRSLPAAVTLPMLPVILKLWVGLGGVGWGVGGYEVDLQVTPTQFSGSLEKKSRSPSSLV